MAAEKAYYHGVVATNEDEDDDYDYYDIDDIIMGVHFQPYDHELVLDYLVVRAKNLPLPPNRIVELDIYKFNPEQLTDFVPNYEGSNMYFITPRTRKYGKGKRPRRSAGDGYWKATGKDKPVLSKENELVGLKKTLVFYRGKHKGAKKTEWIMQEYRLVDDTKSANDGKKLDDVLCKIYLKGGASHEDDTNQNQEDCIDANAIDNQNLQEDYTKANEETNNQNMVDGDATDNQNMVDGDATDGQNMVDGDAFDDYLDIDYFLGQSV